MLKNRFYKVKSEPVVVPTPKGIKRKEIKPRAITETVETATSKNKSLKSKPIPVPVSKKKRLTPEDYLAKHPDLQKYFNSTVDMLHKERRNFGAPSVCVLVKYFNDIEFSDEYAGVLKENCLKEFPEYEPVFSGKYPDEINTVDRVQSNIPAEKSEPIIESDGAGQAQAENNSGITVENNAGTAEQNNDGNIGSIAKKYSACTKCGVKYKKGSGPAVCIKCNISKGKSNDERKPAKAGRENS